MTSLCERAEVVISRGRPRALPTAYLGRLVLTASDFDAGGAAELYRRPGSGWRIVWAQPLRGVRPWTVREGLDDRVNGSATE
jgi:competence protein ComEC